MLKYSPFETKWVSDYPTTLRRDPLSESTEPICNCRDCSEAFDKGFGTNFKELNKACFMRSNEVQTLNMTTADLKRYCDNARAYGWEVGRGKPIQDGLFTHPDNPFTKPDWDKDLTRSGFLVTAVENPL